MITSGSNSSVSSVRKLIKSAKARAKARAFCVEGEKLIAEALEAGFSLQQLFYVGATPAIASDGELVEVSEDIMASMASTVSAQPQLAVFAMPDETQASLGSFVPVLVGVNDPGNLGAIARSSEGAGVSTIMTVGDTVDRFNPKVIRASAGSIFRVSFMAFDELSVAVDELKARGYKTYATAVTADAGVSHTEADLANCAVVFGSEAHGLSESEVQLCDEVVAIETEGKLESLNLAASVAVIGFESKRQRAKSS